MLRRLIAAVALCVGVVAVSPVLEVAAAPARPVVTATSYTDCGQSAFLGARTCLDLTTPYGPVITILTSSYGVYAQFGACVDYGLSSFVATPIEWQASNVIANTPGHPGTLSPDTSIVQNTPGYPGYSTVSTCGNAGNFGLLQWFAADANQEFVVAN